MDSDYGDADVDFEAAMLEERLRELFNDIPDIYSGSDVEVADAVHAAVSVGWPDGVAPPADDVGPAESPADPDVIDADDDTGEPGDDQIENGTGAVVDWAAEPNPGAQSDLGYDLDGAVDHHYYDGT